MYNFNISFESNYSSNTLLQFREIHKLERTIPQKVTVNNKHYEILNGKNVIPEVLNILKQQSFMSLRDMQKKIGAHTATVIYPQENYALSTKGDLKEEALLFREAILQTPSKEFMQRAFRRLNSFYGCVGTNVILMSVLQDLKKKNMALFQQINALVLEEKLARLEKWYNSAKLHEIPETKLNQNIFKTTMSGKPSIVQKSRISLKELEKMSKESGDAIQEFSGTCCSISFAEAFAPQNAKQLDFLKVMCVVNHHGDLFDDRILHAVENEPLLVEKEAGPGNKDAVIVQEGIDFLYECGSEYLAFLEDDVIIGTEGYYENGEGAATLKSYQKKGKTSIQMRTAEKPLALRNKQISETSPLSYIPFCKNWSELAEYEKADVQAQEKKIRSLMKQGQELKEEGLMLKDEGIHIEEAEKKLQKSKETLEEAEELQRKEREFIDVMPGLNSTNKNIHLILSGEPGHYVCLQQNLTYEKQPVSTLKESSHRTSSYLLSSTFKEICAGCNARHTILNIESVILDNPKTKAPISPKSFLASFPSLRTAWQVDVKNKNIDYVQSARAITDRFAPYRESKNVRQSDRDVATESSFEKILYYAERLNKLTNSFETENLEKINILLILNEEGALSDLPGGHEAIQNIETALDEEYSEELAENLRQTVAQLDGSRLKTLHLQIP